MNREQLGSIVWRASDVTVLDSRVYWPDASPNQRETAMDVGETIFGIGYAAALADAGVVEFEVATYDDLAAELLTVQKTDDGEDLIVADFDKQQVYNEVRDAIGAEPALSELAEVEEAYKARAAVICEAAISQ